MRRRRRPRAGSRVRRRAPAAASAPRASSARGTTSSSAAGARWTPSAPASSRLMSSRFSIRAGEPVERLVGGEQELLARLVAPPDVVAAQRGDRRLGRGERAAQVVADRVQQRGPGAVGLGDDGGLGGAVGELLALADGGGLGGEGREQPLVGGADRSGDAQPELLAQRASSVGGSVVGCAHLGDRRPTRRRASVTLEERDGPEAEGLAGATEELGQRGLAPQDAPGEPGQDRRLGRGATGLRRTPDDALDQGRDEGGHRDEHQERQGVVLVGDREGVERRGEVVVEQQAARTTAAPSAGHSPPTRATTMTTAR